MDARALASRGTGLLALAVAFANCVPSDGVAIPESPAVVSMGRSSEALHAQLLSAAQQPMDYPQTDSSALDAQPVLDASQPVLDASLPVLDAAMVDAEAADANDLRSEHSGRLKYYPASGGSCALPRLRGVDVVAVPRALYSRMAMCGACLSVQGPKGQLIVQVADLCEGCPRDVLDLSVSAYRRAAGVTSETPTGTWRMVACPDAGSIKVRFKEGVSQYWNAFQIRNHRYPIQSVAWRRDGPWTAAERSGDNYFFVRKGMPQGRFALRVTSVLGQTLDLELPGWRAGAIVDTGGQFEI